MVKLVDGGNASSSLSKEDLCRKAKACKEIYEAELSSLDGSKSKKQRLKSDESGSSKRTNTVTGDAAEYDSDETIEMTEEEVDMAYNTVASKFLNDQ
jgi:DNA-repair protein XRCC1